MLAVATGAAARNWAIAGIGVCCCAAGAWIARWRKRRASQEQPLVSLVLLEAESRFVDSHILACIIDSAWGTSLAVGDESSDEFITGEAPAFVVRTREADFLINVFDQPYWQDTQEVLPFVSDIRTQRALAEHNAWLSVDLLQTRENVPASRAYEQIARLVAELSRPASRALLDPASGAVRVFDAELHGLLARAETSELFSSGRGAAVLEVAEDDPLMEAAVAEARRRWPEFTAAFSRRHPEHHFSIKAPITRGGRTEHIWIEVSAIHGDEVRGKLGNDPVDLGDLKLGDPLTVPVSQIEDWLYVLTDRPIGGFTIPAVTSAPRRAKKSRR
jgi:uncharacterized protein YegJ (DUF2314 family)